MKLFSRTILSEKIKESLTSVLPVTGIVLLLFVTLTPVSPDMLVTFLLGAVLLIVGMGLFTLGAESAMTPIGEYVGSRLTKSRNLLLIILISFFVGVMITVSEPDLQVLANQISSVNNMVLIVSVGVGVGLFLVVAMLRILFRVRLKYILLVFYLAVFVLAFFVPSNFLSVAFDSGGVTTGPMTVPFIMALGVGVAAIRSDDSADNDSFGLVALCSIGPILAVMILALIFPGAAEAYTDYSMPYVSNSKDIALMFIEAIPHYMKEVAMAVGPIAIFFYIFRLACGHMEGSVLIKITIGILYTYVGLVLFLVGVNVGFMPIGYYLGEELTNSVWRWLIIPLGMVIGYFIVAAEPAVHVLTKQVEGVTLGAIPGKLLSTTLSIGVAVSVGISMLRVLFGIPILWVLIPGYAIALILSFFVPDIFTSIAFDSGGVASGPMTATFLLPFAVGACSAVGGNVVENAFGLVAMVAMTPLITIQILGLIYRIKQARKASAVTETTAQAADTVIEETTVKITAEDTIIE